MQQRANSTSRAWAPSFHNQWRNSLCTQQHLESRTEKKNNCKTEVFLHPGLLRPLMRTSLLNLLTHIYRSRLLHVYFKAHVDPILNIFNRKLLLYVQWSILTLNKISVGHVLRFAGRLGISVAYVLISTRQRVLKNWSDICKQFTQFSILGHVRDITLYLLFTKHKHYMVYIYKVEVDHGFWSRDFLK